MVIKPLLLILDNSFDSLKYLSSYIPFVKPFYNEIQPIKSYMPVCVAFNTCNIIAKKLYIAFTFMFLLVLGNLYVNKTSNWEY